MSRSVSASCATCLAFLAGLTVQGPTAVAQGSSSLDEITVVAPRLVKRTVGRTAVGAKVELISLTRHVVYTDLNLARHADVMTLEQRVNDVAKEACEQLAQMYPLSDPNTPNCVEQALRSAKGQIDEVVAAAEKEPRH